MLEPIDPPPSFLRRYLQSWLIALLCLANVTVVVIAWQWELARRDLQAQGTTNRIPKFTGPSSIGDGSLTDTGALVSASTPIDMATHQIHNVVDPTSAQDAATQAYVLAHAGGASIGGPVTGGSNKSILYVNPAGILAQDNAHFQWDPGTPAGTLRIGTSAVGATAANQPLQVSTALSGDTPAFFWNTASDGYSGLGFDDNTPTYAASIGYANPTVPITVVRNRAFFATLTADICFLNVTSSFCAFLYSMTQNQVALTLSDGQSAGGGTTNTVKLRYTSAVGEPGSNAGALQASINGGNYANVVVDGLSSTSVNPGVNCGGGASAAGSSRKGRVTPGAGATGCDIVFPYNPISCNITCRSAACTYSISGNTVTTSSTSSIVDYDCN